MRKRCLYGLAFSLAAALAFGLTFGVGRMPARAEDSDAKLKEAANKGKRVKEFIAAFDNGDAKAVAAFWMPEQARQPLA